MTDYTKVHVCSLSTSALKRINASIEEREQDDEVKMQLKWLKVAMTLNSQTQLQNIYSHLGSRGKDPKFRAIRMSRYWKQWRRQIIRGDWEDLTQSFIHQCTLNEIKFNKVELNRCRSELAARHYRKNPAIKFNPLGVLFNNSDLAYIKSYQVPATCSPGYANHGIKFLETDDLKTMTMDISSSDNEGAH
ncbi:hypothetical protein TVAG_211350 [Trichomonas vaginalis G3]|uniref:Uncharacterized protein n=1 Tax=Trichomonas vaginalis (strain ATCC PRA-98 / G3) TaxID=412133 RepID=A2EKX6_TRIV3|nr:hypothetical protein TVAGG3_1014350 [Trichomonas vaginalis G3]EAY06684.1 hypothetical protein TVAG_211350 [Trichomonas vaginalis G3]KAI5491722.1 hypothetical protein TVAGG3_1014350 [Trichomonas vaginalis G3]|eukprot:XP_001318907.1 hypothetical protein [Trichomonas vaginalis G3]